MPLNYKNDTWSKCEERFDHFVIAKKRVGRNEETGSFRCNEPPFTIIYWVI